MPTAICGIIKRSRGTEQALGGYFHAPNWLNVLVSLDKKLPAMRGHTFRQATLWIGIIRKKLKSIIVNICGDIDRNIKRKFSLQEQDTGQSMAKY